MPASVMLALTQTTRNLLDHHAPHDEKASKSMKHNNSKQGKDKDESTGTMCNSILEHGSTEDSEPTKEEAIEQQQQQQPLLEADENLELSSRSSHGSSTTSSKKNAGRDWSGYSADCSSSSDVSSQSSMRVKMDQLLKTLSIGHEHKRKSRSKKSRYSSDDDEEDDDDEDEDDDVTIHGNTYGPTAEDLRRKQEHATAAAAAAAETASDLPLSAQLPQLNGVRVSHPMDPRIDLSTVHHIRVPMTFAETELANAQHQHQLNQQLFQHQLHQHQLNQHQLHLHEMAGTATTAETVPPIGTAPIGLPAPNLDFMAGISHFTIDQYSQMIEAVRPFFQAYGYPPSPCRTTSHHAEPPNNQTHGDGSEISAALGESEGFTSFFSTTHTSATNSSDSDKYASVAEAETAHSHHHHNHHRHPSQAAPEATEPSLKNSQEEGVDDGGDAHESDASSMVVLARTKRKHLRQEGSNPDSTTSSSSEKRVRIQGRHHHSPDQDQHDHLHPLDQQVADGDGAAAPVPAAAIPELLARHHDVVPVVLPRQEDAGSSSSSDQQNQAAAGPLHHRYPDPPRVVSESSSSARGPNESSNANTTSGSASGGNTGSGSNIGSSGSGQGSSGSGNEGKGSSEELVVDGVGGAVGQDGSSNSDTAQNLETTHRIHVKGPTAEGLEHYLHSHGDTAQLPEEYMDDAEREKKIQNKKRKRMNMRREYESKVQRQMESSESGSDFRELLLKPGQQVTLDQVLSFSKTARIVIQATPPFLVVHANAAYCRLTGMDSHAAIGKPISSLLSIVDITETSKTAPQETSSAILGRSVAAADQPQESTLQPTSNSSVPHQAAQALNATRDHAAAVAVGRANAAYLGNEQNDLCLDRLLAASGFGRYHVVQVVGKLHQLLGRDVTVVRPADPINGGLDNGREEGSHGNSSITSSNDCPTNSIVCRMGVSPVVSFIDPDAAVITDRETDNHHHRNKRNRKAPPGAAAPSHGGGPHDPHSRVPTMPRDIQQQHQQQQQYLLRKNVRHQQTTHYVIQLESNESRNMDSIESMSFTSGFVNPNGKSKTDLSGLQPQPINTNGPGNGDNESDDRDDAASGSTEPKMPVGAVG